MADVIQIQYEEMESITQRFASQADKALALSNRLTQAVEALRNGGWQGRDANRFYGEFDADIAPSVKRLAEALDHANSQVRLIAQIFRQAEEEAAALIRGGQGGLSSGRIGIAGSVPYMMGENPYSDLIRDGKMLKWLWDGNSIIGDLLEDSSKGLDAAGIFKAGVGSIFSGVVEGFEDYTSGEALQSILISEGIEAAADIGIKLIPGTGQILLVYDTVLFVGDGIGYGLEQIGFENAGEWVHTTVDTIDVIDRVTDDFGNLVYDLGEIGWNAPVDYREGISAGLSPVQAFGQAAENAVISSLEAIDEHSLSFNVIAAGNPGFMVSKSILDFFYQ